MLCYPNQCTSKLHKNKYVNFLKTSLVYITGIRTIYIELEALCDTNIAYHNPQRLINIVYFYYNRTYYTRFGRTDKTFSQSACVG